MRIRAASPADLPTLRGLDEACFARPWTELGWREELEPAGGVGQVLLAEIDGIAVGFASAPILVTGECELRRIAVRSTHRGRGIARDLLAAIVTGANGAGCERLRLEVAADNHAALALYTRAGLELVGRRPAYYADPPADALLLELELPAEPS